MLWAPFLKVALREAKAAGLADDTELVAEVSYGLNLGFRVRGLGFRVLGGTYRGLYRVLKGDL